MAKTSLKENLIRYLASHNEWRSKGYITDTLKWKYEEKGISKTYLAETCGRKLREAESESRIAVRSQNQSVEYKFMPPERRNSYIPWNSRPDNAKSTLFKV